MSTPTTKRVPPPCWTHDETLALIHAYGARWLSLNRGNLRTSDWDAVSSAVSDTSLGASKSSIQCRHKIEKLRKRYRAEKQRSLSLPGRFVSSWDLFPFLDSMNFGSSSAAALSNQSREVCDQKIADVTEFRLNKNLMIKHGKVDSDLNQDFGLNRDLRSGYLRNYGNIDFDDDFGGLESRVKDYVKIGGDFKSKLGSERDAKVGFGVKMQDFVLPQRFRLKSYGKNDDDKSSPNLDFNSDLDGFPVRTFGDRILGTPPGLKRKNYGKVDGNFNPDAHYDHNADNEVTNGSGMEFYAKTLGDGDFMPLGTRSKNYGRVDGNLNGSVDITVTNWYGSSSSVRSGKKNGDGGVKRDFDPMDELASSITLLTQRFDKMERMKMEMARETQKVRMEMEMKHNQMIMESQKHILNIFVSGFSEKKVKKKKVKMELVSPNMLGKRDEAR